MKLFDKWCGLYRIIEKAENSTFYRLAELDGTPLSGTTAGNRLKKFYSREIADILRRQEALTGESVDVVEEVESEEDGDVHSLS